MRLCLVRSYKHTNFNWYRLPYSKIKQIYNIIKRKMKQEYIVGDVVEYYDMIMTIRDLTNIDCIGLSSSKEKIIRCYAPIWQLKPVPLSTIILKYNGWGITEVNCEDENPELHYDTFSKCRIMADIRYYPNWSDDNRKFFVFVDSEEILHFQYVQELQHLLWAMGKDSTMIV